MNRTPVFHIFFFVLYYFAFSFFPPNFPPRNTLLLHRRRRNGAKLAGFDTRVCDRIPAKEPLITNESWFDPNTRGSRNRRRRLRVDGRSSPTSGRLGGKPVAGQVVDEEVGFAHDARRFPWRFPTFRSPRCPRSRCACLIVCWFNCSLFVSWSSFFWSKSI